MKKRATIVDVAKRAEVSTATAARVFDPAWKDRVRESTQKKVLQAAHELDYHRGNALVRGIQGRGTNMIGLVISPGVGHFYGNVLLKFSNCLQKIGKQVLVFEAAPSMDLSPIIEQVHNYRVDGVVVTAAAFATSLAKMIRSSLPVVTFNVHSVGVSGVYCDSAKGVQEAARYLLETGHHTFKVVTGDRNPSVDPERSSAFCEYITSNGGEILDVVDADYGYWEGRKAGKLVFSGRIPDAVFCVEDFAAMGVMDEARENFGLRIPEDVSVMGFDGVDVGGFAPYSLSTVETPTDKMICETVKILQALLKEPEQQIQTVCPMTLRIRGSVANRTGKTIVQEEQPR